MARAKTIRGRDGEPHLGTDDARQGARTGYMRRVLVLSVLLGAVVLIGAWLMISASHPARPAGQGGQVQVVSPAPAGPKPASGMSDQLASPSSPGGAASH